MTADSRSPLDAFRAQIRTLVADDSKWPAADAADAAERLRDELCAMLDDPGLTEASLSHYAQAVVVATTEMRKGVALASGGLAKLAEGSSWIDEVWSRQPDLAPEQVAALFEPPQSSKPT